MRGWNLSKVDVRDGTRIEIYDRIPGDRGWAHKVGKVHMHGARLHMAKKDCDMLEVVPQPPIPVLASCQQLWRTV